MEQAFGKTGALRTWKPAISKPFDEQFQDFAILTSKFLP